MTVAIQDRIPHNHCWGCGTLNPRGLHIKSFVEGDEVVCTFRPSPDHMAGPTTVLYGGIIAAVIDCHAVCTAQRMSRTIRAITATDPMNPHSSETTE